MTQKSYSGIYAPRETSTNLPEGMYKDVRPGIDYYKCILQIQGQPLQNLINLVYLQRLPITIKYEPFLWSQGLQLPLTSQPHFLSSSLLSHHDYLVFSGLTALPTPHTHKLKMFALAIRLAFNVVTMGLP